MTFLWKYVKSVILWKLFRVVLKTYNVIRTIEKIFTKLEKEITRKPLKGHPIRIKPKNKKRSGDKPRTRFYASCTWEQYRWKVRIIIARNDFYMFDETFYTAAGACLIALLTDFTRTDLRRYLNFSEIPSGRGL